MGYNWVNGKHQLNQLKNEKQTEEISLTGRQRNRQLTKDNS